MGGPRAFGAVAALGVTALIAGCGGAGGTPVNATSSSSSSSGPATLSVNVGGVDPAHPLYDFLAFYPSTISAHPGDTLRLVNPTKETPHTVTFGVLPDHSNQPPLLTPGVGFTAIAGGPCISTQPVTATSTTCPGAPAGAPPAAPAGTPPPEVTLPGPFSGQPFYNSGVFIGGQTAVLPLSADIRPGAYRFICLLHPTMVATLTVVPASSPTQTADALTSAGDRQLAADRTDAGTAAAGVVTPPAGMVQAGAVGKEVTINQFFPQSATVSAGQTVTWKDDGYEPHVIVLGRTITPEDPLVFGAPTLPPGSAYAGGLAVSGLIGGKPFPSDSYALRFTTAGSYPYTCAIHPGMAGVITVT
jgi:plastocyanin